MDERILADRGETCPARAPAGLIFRRFWPIDPWMRLRLRLAASGLLLAAILVPSAWALDPPGIPPPPPAPPQSEPLPADGEAAPKIYPMAEFAVDDLSGGRLDSKELRGKVVLIDIWATWCGPCVAAGAEIDRIYKDLRGRGVEVMGIAVDSGTKEKVAAAAKRFGMTYPIALWNQELAQRILGLQAVPTYILVRPDWTVHKLWVGATPPGLMRREIEKLLASAPAEAGKDTAGRGQ